MRESRDISFSRTIDKWTIVLYLILIVFGWLNIYGASYDFDQSSMFDFSNRAGKQFVWILSAFVLAGIILLLDARVYDYFGYIIYIMIMLLLLVTIFVAKDVKGSRSWLELGPVSFQPAELSKIATALALAKFMSAYNYSIKNIKDLLIPGMLLFIPFALIIMQKETGSALVFVSFLLMFYREGMSGVILLLVVLAVSLFVVSIGFSETIIQEEKGSWGMVLAMLIIISIQLYYALTRTKHKKEALYLLGGVAAVALITFILNIWLTINYDHIAIITTIIASLYWVVIGKIKHIRKYSAIVWISLASIFFCFSADYIFNSILQPHQQIRIKVLLNMEDDLRGAGYNVNQSKIAIGSGGLMGKGYLNGTQTKLKYVPEQDTDFIFCTVGEEWGFVGSVALLGVYLALILNIIKIAERQPNRFGRIYGYCIAGIFFFHLFINIGMVIGVMPVIGIPLPFLSYGGSSLWSFTVMLFILLRIDTTRFKSRGANL